LLTACNAPDSGETAEVDTGHDGVDCGEPSTWDVEVTAMVVSADDGRPLEGIEVSLDDRGWEDEVLGTGTTARNGRVTFTAEGVTSLPNCWGTVLNYWLVATDPADTTRVVEDDMNTELYNAIDGGTLATDVSDRPLELP
jgi:hypothetical protein